jgi:hypothetical protein
MFPILIPFKGFFSIRKYNADPNGKAIYLGCREYARYPFDPTSRKRFPVD